MDGSHLREAPEHLDEVAGLEALAGSGDEHDQRLTRVPTFTDDEVTEVARPGLLVVCVQPLLARPVADREADGVAEIRRQEALLDADHLVPAACAVESQVDAVVAGRKRVFELVPVVVLRRRGHDRLERRIGEAADPDERIAHLPLLLGELRLVGEVLEAAAAARAEMAARGLDARSTRLDELRDDALREPALDLRDPGTDRVAGKSAAGEDDEPVVTPHAVPAVGERVDVELELLSILDGSRHRRPSVASGYVMSRRLVRTTASADATAIQTTAMLAVPAKDRLLPCVSRMLSTVTAGR
jgi:hypothetical protein